MKKGFYLLSAGELIKRDDSIEFINEDNLKSNLPIFQVDDIYVLSSLKVSCDCLKLLANNGVAIHYFDKHEYYVGTFYPKLSKTFNGDVLVKQVQAFTNAQERLSLAKETILGAFKNMRKLIKYHSTRKHFNTSNIFNFIDENISNLVGATNINEIMLIEANVHRQYYSLWNNFFISDVHFDKRIKNPPNDIINSLLSFINSLLYALIVSEIYKTSLNPTISYLHEPSKSRVSLSYDVAEVFRPILVERLIFSLINKNIIRAEDFDTKVGRLTDDAIKRVLFHWDNKINETIYHRTLKRNVSYRYLIREELFKIIRHLNGEKPYKAFVMWW